MKPLQVTVRWIRVGGMVGTLEGTALGVVVVGIELVGVDVGVLVEGLAVVGADVGSVGDKLGWLDGILVGTGVGPGVGE